MHTMNIEASSMPFPSTSSNQDAPYYLAPEGPWPRKPSSSW